jgi:hypothetical protein
MNVDAVLTAPEFAELAGVYRQAASRIFARAEKGIKWNDCQLAVRWEKLNAKRQRVVRVATLPGNLILKFEKKNALPLPGADNPTAPCTQNRAVACPPDSTKQDFSPAGIMSRFGDAPKHKQDVALNKCDALRSVNDLVLVGGWKKDDAVKLVAEESKVTAATIYNWFKAVRGFDEQLWPAVLVVDRRGGNVPKMDVA